MFPDRLTEGLAAAGFNFAIPPESKVQVAILAADVAGYSKLMAIDEWATVATLEEYREVFKEGISRNSGRVVDTAGDSVLAIFTSAIDAVEAALGIQEELDDRNEARPQDLRMRFRIGVNYGAVIEKDDGRVYGLDVNVAARIESLSEPGGATISDGVHRRVMGKVSRHFEDIGVHRVKNIAKPVRAYSVAAESSRRRRWARACEGKASA